MGGNLKPYETRIINISSHSKRSGDEVAELSDNELVKSLKDLEGNKIYEELKSVVKILFPL